jgi:hypothetical protein
VHWLAATDPSTGNVAYTMTAILAASVIVLGGLATLVRAIWKTANILRDNTVATQNLTARFDDMAASVDGRFDRLSERVLSLENREFGRHDGLYQPGAPGQYERAHEQRPGSH